MQFLEILKLIISILPLLIDAIKIVEEAIPGQGKGEQKLTAIKSILESTYQVTSEKMPNFDVFWKSTQSVITGLVKAFNATGVFTK